MSNKERLIAIISQGTGEQIARSVTVTGMTPVIVETKAWDVTSGGTTDVSNTVLSGSSSANGAVISFNKIGSLTLDHRYRHEVKFTDSGNTFVIYFLIDAEW